MLWIIVYKICSNYEQNFNNFCWEHQILFYFLIRRYFKTSIITNFYYQKTTTTRCKWRTCRLTRGPTLCEKSKSLSLWRTHVTHSHCKFRLIWLLRFSAISLCSRIPPPSSSQRTQKPFTLLSLSLSRRLRAFWDPKRREGFDHHHQSYAYKYVAFFPFSLSFQFVYTLMIALNICIYIYSSNLFNLSH